MGTSEVLFLFFPPLAILIARKKKAVRKNPGVCLELPRSNCHINYFHWKFLRFHLFALLIAPNFFFWLSLPPRAWAAAASLVSHCVCKKRPPWPPLPPTHPPLLSPPSTAKRCLPNDTESNCRTFQHPVSRAGTRLQGHSAMCSGLVGLATTPGCRCLILRLSETLGARNRHGDEDAHSNLFVRLFVFFPVFLTCFSGDRW